MLQRVLLATFSNPLSFSLGSLLPAVFHFDPFGTEFREPGRVSYPMLRFVIPNPLAGEMGTSVTKILPTYCGVPGVRVPVGI